MERNDILLNEQLAFRTNSFTGRENPIGEIPFTLLMEPNQYSVLLQLSEFTPFKYKGISNEAVLRLREMTDIFRDSRERDLIADFINSSSGNKLVFYYDIIQEMSRYFGYRLNFCCWYSSFYKVLSRKQGYGRRLCKENGILSTPNSGGYPILRKNMTDVLIAYEEPIVPFKHEAVSKYLISKKELDELLEVEEECDTILAETCMKKDVYPVLERYHSGILGRKYAPLCDEEEKKEKEIDIILKDLL